MPPESQLESSAPDKRTKILATALQLLANYGFHGFSIKQLAAQAEVATGTIYLYFKDKQDLIEQLYMAIIRQIADAVFANLDAGNDESALYRRFCRNYWNFCVSNPAIMLSKGQFDHLPPDVLRNQYSSARELFKPLFDLFERCRKAGTLVDLPVEVLGNFSFEPYCHLARKHHLGLVTVDDVQLEKIISVSWQAISRTPLPSASTKSTS